MNKLLLVLLMVFSLNTYAVQNVGDIKIGLEYKAPEAIFDTPLDFYVDSYKAWMQALETIRTSRLTEVTFVISGLGGVMYYESQVAHKIQQLQAAGIKINMIVRGKAVSANAFITCFADTVQIDNYSMLYFHAPFIQSVSAFGTVTLDRLAPMQDPTDNLDVIFNYDQCLKTKSLTPQDIALMKQGKAIIFERRTGDVVKYTSNADINDIKTTNFQAYILLGQYLISGLLLFIVCAIILKLIFRRK